MTDVMIARVNVIPPQHMMARQTMNKQLARLATFRLLSNCDPYHPVLLAAAGLYYSGTGDSIQCYSCCVVLSGWLTQGIDPVQLHQQSTPNCPHLQGLDLSNMPVNTPDSVTCTTVSELMKHKYLLLRDPASLSSAACRSLHEVGGSEEQILSAGSELDSHPSGFLAASATGGTDWGSPVTVADAIAEASQVAVNTGVDWEVCKTSVTERLKTFEHWPVTAQAHPAELAEAGFVYTGTQDRVQCVFCEGFLRNWQVGDVPLVEHERFFPSCPMVRHSQSESPVPSLNVAVCIPNMPRSHRTPPLPMSMPRTSTPELPTGVDEGALALLPPTLEATGIVTERPKHPNMAVEAARFASFRKWPPGKTQTPQHLAKAGFFYAGFNDSVKCFFCDGGLRNWECDDDPWHEHARWFPKCKYVRQVKGDHFVEQVLVEEADKVQQTATFDGGGRGNSPARKDGVRQRSASMGSASAESRRTVEQREVTARMDTPVVRAVLSLDIPQELVRRAIEQRLKSTGDDFPNLETLLETVFEINPANVGNLGGARQVGELQEGTGAPRSLLEENRQLKEQRTCKICMDEEVCVVFVPCGHLVCCATCAPPLSKCPICRSTIRGTVRTYMS